MATARPYGRTLADVQANGNHVPSDQAHSLKLVEAEFEGSLTHRWIFMKPGEVVKVSERFTTRARMLSNCVDTLSAELLDTNLVFVDIQDNTKNLLISAARTRIRLNISTFSTVAVVEKFHDRGHGDMTGIVGIPYHSNSGGEE